MVTQVRTPTTDGYTAVQIAYGEIDPRKVTKPLAGHFAKAGVTPRRHVVEIRTADAGSYALGQELTVETFDAGQLVDVVGTSKGKGFAGVMKRHGFSRPRQLARRPPQAPLPGSIGALRHAGPCLQGVRMAGRMGGERRHHPEPHRARGRRRAGL